MAPLTASERLRLHLKRLLKPHGTASALVRYSESKGVPRRISKQALSYFRHHNPNAPTTAKQSRRFGVQLDDLDTIAGFFRVSIGELFDETRTGDLQPEERRVVYAFRALSGVMKDHFLAMLEGASLQQKTIEHARAENVELISATSRMTLTALREDIERIMTELAVVAATIPAAPDVRTKKKG